MRALRHWLKRRLFPFPYRNPWPQAEELNPWLDRADALVQISAQRQRGGIDAATARQLRHWHEHGYLILRKAIDPKRIEHVLHDFRRFDAERAIIGGHRRPLERDKHGHWVPTINVHMQSDAIKDVFLDPTILRWLGLILGKPVYGCQSINFFAGSNRALHQDHAHMTTRPYGYLAAAWIALEDIHSRSGPLLYVPGSQWLPHFDPETLSRMVQPGEDAHAFVANHLKRHMQAHLMRPQCFAARRGDVLLWHCNLAHGGAPVRDPRRSRLSMACHYAAFDVSYFHAWSGIQRDPADVIEYKGAPYLPEYYDDAGGWVPTRAALEEQRGSSGPVEASRREGAVGWA